jgi:DNA-binding transcriptional LysR family regulator
MNEAIDLRQFRYFLAVSEERNFGRAALRLHISQPPLSRQIRQLEDQLGVKLFLRHKTGVTLTAAGAAFLPEVRRTLAQAENAVASAQAAQGADGQFVVGYTTVFDRSVIPDVFAELRRSFPNWQCLTRGKHSISLVREVRNGTIDAAFIGLFTSAPGVATETILEEAMVVALPASHPLARKRRIGFDDLRGVPMFWFERRLNPGFYDHCQAFFEHIGFKPDVIPEPSDHHILLGLIAEGQGFALIPASMQNVKRQGVSYRALKESPDSLSMGIAVAYLDRDPSPVLRRFLELVRAQSNT